MYFKKLELFGFKSFADKTTLTFEPGITAIVGPNGCGKSNVFDSIRWVLGEQSIKELRGATKEDVIFNGTEKKPSLGFAEVSVVFSNESRSLPLENDEVKITRRLFRSGESEYLMNDSVCRLKDIHELLLGTGMGTQAYSMVQQGRVDLIVRAKPEERRFIIDEAAGITKYKAKKKEAINKLKAADDNLLRVNDIAVEVKRQIGSIERQANKARKYKEEFEKLKTLEIKVAQHQVRNLTADKARLESELQQLTSKQRTLIQELEALQADLTNEINYLGDIEQKINNVHNEEIRLDGQIDVNNRQIGFNQERIENVNQTEKRLTEQKDQLIFKCRQQQEKIELMKQELEALKETMEYNGETLKEKRQQLATIEQTIKDAKSKIKDHEENILNMTSTQVSLRNDLTDIMKAIQGSLARKRRLDHEFEKVNREKDEINARAQNVDYQVRCVQGNLSELEQERETVNQNLSELETQMSSTQLEINECEKKRVFYRSQKEFIEKLNTQYADIPDPSVTSRFISQEKPQEYHTGIIGKVKEWVALDEESVASLRSRFPDLGQDQLFEIICETKFIELDPQQILAKIRDIEQALGELETRRQTLEYQIGRQNKAFERIKQDIQIKEKSLSILQSQRQDISAELKKLQNELELVELELIEVKDALESDRKQEEELNFKLDTINQEISWAQNDIKEKQDWISDKIQEKEETTVCIAQIETELESDRDKLKRQQENFHIFSENLDNSLEEIKRIDDEVSTFAQKKEQYRKESEDLERRIAEIRKQKDSLRDRLTVHENEKEEQSRKINSKRAQINALEDQLEKIKSALHEQQMKEQKLAFSEQGIRDRLQQAYKIDYEEAIRQMEEMEAQRLAEGGNVEDTSLGFDPETVDGELEKLRKRCESYGNVNLAAMDEYEELKERFEFLTQQQADLLEAKSQLMNTIRRINKQTRQMFMDTFTKVSEEFRIYFRMLFGGGEAQLVLLDPENVLESGIDIIARPPGKKLQNISLLSGGEKTLTAIALIFGVFKVNPSPFCVLDEIDAALDEANVGRFSYLLQDFSKVAQFIVITHNKKTISAADILYGVTMPETGISKIVSVKFSDEKKKEELTAAA